jgi:hypothetical protein
MCVGMLPHHSDDFRVDGLRQHTPARRDVVDDLVERGSLNLLSLEVGHGVHEVEADAALAQLADEQVLLF